MLATLISNGTVITDGAQFKADVGIDDEGRIAGLWRSGQPPAAHEIVDAAGKYVMPGAIDAHFHTQTGTTYGSHRADTMESGGVSAAMGGITTVLTYVWGEAGEPLSSYLGKFFDLARPLAVCDFSVHCGIRPEFDLIKTLPEAFELGVRSFKMHYGYKKTGLGRMTTADHRLAAMEVIGRNGGLMMFHCEDGFIIDYLEDKLIAAGQGTWEHFLESRPNLAEAEAVRNAIELGKMANCPVYPVHVSTAEALESIVEAQARGLPVFTETCPQYMTLTNAELAPDRWGVLAKVAPPLRLQPDLEAMWEGVRLGQIETIGSDHSAYTLAWKNRPVESFFHAQMGTSIVEVMLPIVFSEGVLKGRISPERFVSAFTDRPARRFGLYPRKGTLQPGADGDVLIWDPDAKWTIHASELSNPCGYNIYEDWQVQGRPLRSWLRGRSLLQDGRVHAEPGSGQFVPQTGLSA